MELTQKADIKEDIEYFVLNYDIAYEKSGFRNGFVITTHIFAECMTIGRITEHITENIPENPFSS